MISPYGALARSRSNGKLATGWIPPLPDVRDYPADHKKLGEHRKKLGISEEVKKAEKKAASSMNLKGAMGFSWMPSKKNLKKDCSPIENQGALGSCTAHAAVGVVEYFEKRANDEHVDGSRLFVYKATRNLMGVTGDTGAWIRNTMGALVHCGCAPERYWPYTDHPTDFDAEPPAFVYAVADEWEALKYFCHDPLGSNKSKTAVLFSVKLYIAMRIPSMFGFYGFENGHWDGNEYVMPYANGEIYYPGPYDPARWGHAIVAVGYDDNKEIKNNQTGYVSKGALLIRNSWGTDWGDAGYGWLPYDYIMGGLALDFWSLLNMKWVDSKKFGL